MDKTKRIGLVAHDNRKKDMSEYVAWNWEKLINHELICTGTTGKIVEESLLNKVPINKTSLIRITKLKSGPLGGDQQLGAMVAEGKVDMIVFLWDPMEPQPHDVDVKALLRITALYNIPIATNRSTADFLISSPLFNEKYQPVIKDYASYIGRKVDY